MRGFARSTVSIWLPMMYGRAVLEECWCGCLGVDEQARLGHARFRRFQQCAHGFHSLILAFVITSFLLKACPSPFHGQMCCRFTLHDHRHIWLYRSRLISHTDAFFYSGHFYFPFVRQGGKVVISSPFPMFCSHLAPVNISPRFVGCTFLTTLFCVLRPSIFHSYGHLLFLCV